VPLFPEFAGELERGCRVFPLGGTEYFAMNLIFDLHSMFHIPLILHLTCRAL
jgi:hypothetical protein